MPLADARDIALTRNLSFGDIIDEMSRILTLTYFSDARYLSPNGTKSAFTTTNFINVYHYNQRNIILAYAIAFGTSALAVAMGLYIVATSGYRNGTTDFSSILWATIRNPGLGSLVQQSAPASETRADSSSMTADPHVLKMKLKYGTLIDVHTSDVERREAGENDLSNIEAFGVPGQV